MQLVPVIITYPDTPFAVTHGHRFAAGQMVQDVSRVFNRITKKAMRYTTQTVQLHSSKPMDPLVRTAGVRNTSASWWDAWAVLRAAGHDERDDVYCVWHANRLTDVTGIAQPAAPHEFDGHINELGELEVADPALGGIATNGFGQIANAVASGLEGELYRNNLLYAAHEVGHALGRHHTPNPLTGLSDPVANALESIMGYGYANFAGGYKGGSPPRYPNPMLATPDEIATWRRHAIFEEIPERWTATEPGWVNDLILVRRDDQAKLLDELHTSNGRGRLLIGSLTAEFGDAIE
jgi:hypothetical protein